MFRSELLFTFTINNISYSLPKLILKNMDMFSGILNDEISDPNAFNIQFDNISPEQIDYIFSALYSQHVDFVCKNVAETLIIESS